jgi:hypothetical protein
MQNEDETGSWWQHVGEVLEGMAFAGHRREVRAQAMALEDLFLLLCFMEMMGLPNPAALYLADVQPYLVEEFHLWHRRIGLRRSPLATFSCC